MKQDFSNYIGKHVSVHKKDGDTKNGILKEVVDKGTNQPFSQYIVVGPYVHMFEDIDYIKEIETLSDTCEGDEFRYCLVGNIVQESYDENHKIRKGTKAFRPGTKVCVSQNFCGDGGENRYVIGMSRHKKYIKIITAIKHIENFRFQKIYKPAILKLMAVEDRETWYKNTEEEKRYIENEAKLLNSVDNPYLKKEKVEFGTYYSGGFEKNKNNKASINDNEYRSYNIYDSNDKSNPVTTVLRKVDNNIYTYISVYYEDGSVNKTYSYSPGEYDVKVGDRVLVERNDEYVTGFVTDINYYKRNEAPCTPEILKEIEEIIDSNYIAKTSEEIEIERMSPKEKEFFDKWDIKPFDVLKHRTYNKDEIKRSNRCGCYYCERIYDALEIEDWLERDAKQTAICPYCGETFVLGDDSGYPIYDFEFIEDMNNYFF